MRELNIVYAEDNIDDVLILKLALKRAGMTCTLRAVNDGEGAVAWLRGDGEYEDRAKNPLPDVLLLDLKMPRMSGFDVLKWMRESNAYDALPVVILSSSDDPSDLQRAEGLKVTRYFMKSASCQDLIGYLKTIA